mmetsp:Transcript_11022/g.25851  ORF Transcript_11022/g.25851 Transcript_11022/m.25851 type:complete len:231 (-) Transcript_11022:1106-1798(-)
MLLRHLEARVDRRRGRPPVLVQLEPHRARANNVVQALGGRGVALAGEPEVERHVVGGLEHHLEVGRVRGARRGGGARRGARPAAHQRGDPRGDGLVRELRADTSKCTWDGKTGQAGRDEKGVGYNRYLDGHLGARGRLHDEKRVGYKCTWASIPPAVTMRPSPAMASVLQPTTIPGVTPSITSGLPALPSPTMVSPLMPMSHFTIPETASMTSALVITTSNTWSAVMPEA